jgi:hypothetical protein
VTPPSAHRGRIGTDLVSTLAPRTIAGPAAVGELVRAVGGLAPALPVSVAAPCHLARQLFGTGSDEASPESDQLSQGPSSSRTHHRLNAPRPCVHLVALALMRVAREPMSETGMEASN